jgi:hypothetical protein
MRRPAPVGPLGRPLLAVASEPLGRPLLAVARGPLEIGGTTG